MTAPPRLAITVSGTLSGSSLALGFWSLHQNIKEGNTLGAAIDAVVKCPNFLYQGL